MREKFSLFFFLLIFLFSCNKKSNDGGGGVDNGGIPEPCDSTIVFSPREVSGGSPLSVTYTADFKAVNSEGITTVQIDFGGDGIIDEEYKYDITPVKSFSYSAVYSSLGEFQDVFHFFWQEVREDGNVKFCKASEKAVARVTFVCPKPSLQLVSQTKSGKSVSLWLRPTNISLEQVTFYAGFDEFQKVTCVRDEKIPGSCIVSVAAPTFGDWSLCWYAESYCGNKSDTQCLSFVVSYPFSDVLFYGVGQAINLESFSDKIVAITPPYISLISPDGDVVSRFPGASEDIRWLKVTSEGAWFLGTSGFYFIDFSGKLTPNVVNPSSIFGSVAFDIYETSSKRYAIIVRSFEGEGDILVFDITSFDASTPLCKKSIPAGAMILEFINGYAFIGYINQLHAYKIDFVSEVCDIGEPKIYDFPFPPALFDIDGDSVKAVAAYTTDILTEKGKIFAFGFDFSAGTFYNIGDTSVLGSQDILALRVSPYNVSRVAIAYLNESGEYRAKIYDFQSGQSVGGTEGLKIPEKPIFITFLSDTTIAVIDEKNNLSVLSFPVSSKVKKIGGFRSTKIKTSQVIDINCDTGKSFLFVPDGGGIAKLDITPVFSPSGGFPSISSYISKDALAVRGGNDGKIYAIFNDNGLFVSDIDFSFSVSLDTSDIVSFSVGSTYFIIGGESGTYYAKKTFSSFLRFTEHPQLKKSIYIPPLFFLFSGNILNVFDENLAPVFSATMDCQDIVVSDDAKELFCLNSFGIRKYEIQGDSIIEKEARTFYLPIGNVLNSDFEEGHIFFISDLGTSKNFGVIRGSDLKLVLFTEPSIIPPESDLISISAKRYCLPHIIFSVIYGNFPGGGISRGFLVRLEE